jgi:hypothetical protein
MTSHIPPRRRWFRYSLRTLFVLVTVFGIWLGVQVKWIRDRHEALNWLRESELTYDYGSAPAPWSIRVLGESGIQMIGSRPTTYLGYKEEELPPSPLPKLREIQPLFPEAYFPDLPAPH